MWAHTDHAACGDLAFASKQSAVELFEIGVHFLPL